MSNKTAEFDKTLRYSLPSSFLYIETAIQANCEWTEIDAY